MFVKIILDCFFASIAGCGFGAISNPPKRAFLYIAILSAMGHCLRTILMSYCKLDIATSSLFAGILIGFSSLPFSKISYCTATVLYIPALLPMIPGKYAYNTIFALISFLQNTDDKVLSSKYMDDLLSNLMITSSVIFVLAVGATMPVFLFPNKAYQMTRRKK